MGIKIKLEDLFKPASAREVSRRAKKDIYQNHIFKLELRGNGSTPEEAWEDAVESLYNEPGEPPDFTIEKGPIGG